jgi:hypothetical protein
MQIFQLQVTTYLNTIEANMALLDSLFGQVPSYYGGLLGEDELSRLRQQAQEQGTLNTAMALLQAGAPSRTPGGGALAIAQGLQQGQQAYRQALNQGLQEKMAGLQVQDLMRKRQEEEAVRRFLPQIMQPGQVTEQLTMYGQPTQGVIRDDEGNLMPGGGVMRTQQPSTINRDALQQLALAAPEQFAKLSASLKALQPEYKAVGDYLYEISPYGGEAKQVATGGKKAILTGEESNIALRLFGTNDPEALKEIPGSSDAIEKASIALKKAGATTLNMPTGEERKAAVLANRMNFGVQQMNQAIGQDPSAAMPNTAAEAARFFTRTEFIPNKLNTEQRQIVEGAQLDILDAALTLGTGAAYTREQLEGYRKSYFPQLNDTAATVKSKQDRLQNLLESAQIASGRAVSNIPTKMPKQPLVPYPITTETSGLPDGVIVRKRQ